MSDVIRRESADEWTQYRPWGRRTVARKGARDLYSRLRNTTWGHGGIMEIYILWPGDVLEFVTKHAKKARVRLPTTRAGDDEMSSTPTA